ncbi:dual specificity phosphatase [Dipodascopsis uninucleata]
MNGKIANDNCSPYSGSESIKTRTANGSGSGESSIGNNDPIRRRSDTGIQGPQRSASISSPFGFPLTNASLSSSRRRRSNLVLTLPPIPSHLRQYREQGGETPHDRETFRFPSSVIGPQTAYLYSPAESPMSSQLRDSYFGEFRSDNPEFERKHAYPNGPVEVYDDNIFLYSEPSKFTASKFDVVINVAREVSNPFESYESDHCLSIQQFDNMPPLSPSNVAQGSSESSSSPLGEKSPVLSGDSSSTYENAMDTDSKASEERTPEYISIPWDHTSKLTNDLPYLTSVMAHRVSEGKKVLVHCQCGVSRSASLVVAFVMKEKGWDLNTAYAWVKHKAPAIGPNMGLVYQLMEWGRILNNDKIPENPDFQTPNEKDKLFNSR